jgi:hypothetical protein
MHVTSTFSDAFQTQTHNRLFPLPVEVDRNAMTEFHAALDAKMDGGRVAAP